MPFLVASLIHYQEYADLIANTKEDVEAEEAFTDMEVKTAMQEMWADSGVQQAVSKGHEFALHDNLD